MDYSILLKICKPYPASSPFLFHSDQYTYCNGIIDFLQQYTWTKKAELELKSMLKEKEKSPARILQNTLEDFARKWLDILIDGPHPSLTNSF